jgi:hypothetical protein
VYDSISISESFFSYLNWRKTSRLSINQIMCQISTEINPVVVSLTIVVLIGSGQRKIQGSCQRGIIEVLIKGKQVPCEDRAIRIFGLGGVIIISAGDLCLDLSRMAGFREQESPEEKKGETISTYFL